MRRVSVFSLGMITALLCCAQILAQQSPGRWGIGVYASGIKLIGGNKDECVIDYASGLSFKYTFSRSLTGEASVGLGWVRPRDPDSYFKVGSSPYRTYLYPWSLNLRYSFAPEHKLNPYIGIGAGLIHWNLRNVSSEDDWFPIPESGVSISGSQLNTSLIGMIGSEIFLSNRFGFDLIVRYSHMLNQDLDIIGTGDKNNGLVEVRLGAFLYFGGTKQEHMNVEESAAVPEPTIVSQPETPPKSTPAPSPTETAPTPAPTPESRPATPFAPGKTVIFPEITFVSGESAPDPAASKVLDQVFEILNKNPEIRLEIIGHTDSVGSEKSNQALSKKRAEFVINYLIHRGIASDRLVAGWYGEMKPIASNETAEGRSQNRRIEFIQLEK